MDMYEQKLPSNSVIWQKNNLAKKEKEIGTAISCCSLPKFRKLTDNNSIFKQSDTPIVCENNKTGLEDMQNAKTHHNHRPKKGNSLPLQHWGIIDTTYSSLSVLLEA